jgi:hypothetical protein
MGALAGDRKVLDGSGRLGAPVGFVGNFSGAEAVFLLSQSGLLG